MNLRFKNLILSLLSILLLILSFFYIYSSIKKDNSNLIKFNNQHLSDNFEINISKNIDDIKDYLNNYKFIQSYSVKKEESLINIYITLKKPFAKNKLNKEIIFYDNSIASFSFFDMSFIDSINLIDTSQESLQINNYLEKNFSELMKIFKIDQIQYIDERRYDLILDNNIKIMLPKIIDKKLLIFIEKNFNLLKNKTDFKEYLDFRNFNDDTIRIK